MTPSHSSRKVEAGCRAGQGGSAFSLIEIMTVVALLSFIILGLVAMFNQTRKAFTSSMTQVDVLESGRMAADMIGRELEQVASTRPAGAMDMLDLSAQTWNMSNTVPLTQPLVNPADIKTNTLQSVYFVTRNNQYWNAIGYRLTNYYNGVGTLYRYSSNNIYITNTTALYNMPWNGLGNFWSNLTPGPNFSRIIDGVVDFRIVAYDTYGRPFPLVCQTNGNTISSYYYVNQSRTGSMFVQTNQLNGDQSFCGFTGDALPAYVEIELGVLEDRALAKYQALAAGGEGPGTTAWSYLSNHVGQVHIFRQRVSIRNVNPAAYP